jgi:hypothetical protein
VPEARLPTRRLPLTTSGKFNKPVKQVSLVYIHTYIIQMLDCACCVGRGQHWASRLL